MTASFPTLAEVAAEHWVDYNIGACDGCARRYTNIGTVNAEHGQHVAQVWREACTIRTVEQLDALPPETVIKTEGGSIACRHYTGIGVVFGDERPFPWTSSLATELPGLLLWHPDWSQP